MARVEAVRGGTAAVFGSSTPGGIVNVISKSGETAASIQRAFLIGLIGFIVTDQETTTMKLGFIKGFIPAAKYLPIAFPFALLTVVGGINVTTPAGFLRLEQARSARANLPTGVDLVSGERIEGLAGVERAERHSAPDGAEHDQGDEGGDVSHVRVMRTARGPSWQPSGG